MENAGNVLFSICSQFRQSLSACGIITCPLWNTLAVFSSLLLNITCFFCPYTYVLKLCIYRSTSGVLGTSQGMCGTFRLVRYFQEFKVHQCIALRWFKFIFLMLGTLQYMVCVCERLGKTLSACLSTVDQPVNQSRSTVQTVVQGAFYSVCNGLSGCVGSLLYCL